MRAAPNIVVVSVFVLWAAQAAAQPGPAQPGDGWPSGLQVGFGFLGAETIGEFATAVDGAAGVLAHADARLSNSAFSLGGEIGYLVYGRTTRTVALGGLIPEIPDASVEVQTVNEILLLHARVRAQRRSGRWRPYADGLVGFVNLSTKTSIPGVVDCSTIDGTTACSQGNVAEATHAQDLVPSYGAGVGLTIVFRPSPRVPRLDVSARYLRGGEARYLTEGAIRREDGRVIPDFSRSRTDMVAFYIGVAFGR